MKLNIQLFGGRGANSPRTERLNIVANNNNERITFNQIKKGDTFKVDSEGNGGTYNLKVGSKMSNGYLVEGTREGENGTFISTLVTDRTYENADKISKLYMVPLSKTRNWRRPQQID